MNTIFLRNLQGNEILAGDIFDNLGNLLVKSGSSINEKTVKLLLHYGIYSININNSNTNPVSSESFFNEFKNNLISQLPSIFNNILSNDSSDSNILFSSVS